MNTEDYAIVIGLNTYPFLNSLKAAESDAESFYQWLTDANGGALDPNHARLILSRDYPAPDDKTPFNVRPFKNDVDEALVRFGVHERKRVGRRFYFYFAGHGIGMSFDEVALLLSGAAPNLLGINIGLAAYRQYFREAAPFDEVVILLDCCRDLEERETAQPTPFKLRRWDERAPDVQDFLALGARFGKKAYEPVDAQSGENRGLFTKVLLDGLRGAAADKTGNVTADTLRSYLKRQLPEYAKRFGKIQKPDFEGNATDLLFCNVAHAWPDVPLEIPSDWQGDVAVVDDEGNELYRNPAPGNQWKVRLRKGKYGLLHVASGNLQHFRAIGHEARLEQEVLRHGPEAPAHLSVIGPHWLAEITVADSQDHVLAQSIGRLEKDLAPGKYRIDVTLSDGHAQREVRLQPGEQKQLASGEWRDVQFASAAPLAGTWTSHEYHMGPASQLSRQPQWSRPGADSRLFVFVRTVDRDRFPLNAAGLRLLTGNEELVSDFEQGVVLDPNAGFMALTADLPRGPYLLTYQPDTNTSRTQPLWLSRGFETHVFIPCREQLHLDDMFLSMAYKGVGFQPDNTETLAVEVVLDGIQHGQNLMSGLQIMEQLIDEKFNNNPWLGVLTAHALRLDREPNWLLIGAVIATLRNVLGNDFPDLRALALDPKQPADRAFEFPPLLRASLQLVQRHSITHQTTIPPTGLTNKIYDGLLADSPWTAWRNLKESGKPRYAVKDMVRITAFDQRGQTVQGPQTNIAGGVAGPVLSGSFQGPVSVGNITTGNITGSSGIAIGHGAQANVNIGGVQQPDAIDQTFAPLKQRVNAMPDGVAKEDAQTALGKLITEARKGAQADRGRVRRSLDDLEELLPAFRQLASDMFARPDSGVGPVLSDAVQAEAGTQPTKAQALSRFRDWIGNQADEEISTALGLPWVRVRQARSDFLGAENLLAQTYGPVEAGILRYLWEQFEFEEGQPARSIGEQ